MDARRPIIECRDICKTYLNGDVATPVLKNVTFTIDAGEFVAIMGPSGSGKSTLMHILGALDSPTSGTYRLDGRDVSTLTDDELADVRREKIGFVFQSFNLLPRATVLRNAILPLIYAETDPERRETLAEHALNAAGMPRDRWDHLSNQLSGGQMQRVAIARALINSPSIVLADEPTGNLDTKTGEVVLGTFQELNEREHHTIVLITHERYVAEHADRIIHIQDGVIVEDSRNSRRRIVNHTAA
ncbi:MAG TPA: ABC transporter ATP-binding protein [Candidatus Paceibacterota bacterium]|nr:ABC transporter ATP-binding protein [Candidatus Paceibacterota bacterium]